MAGGETLITLSEEGHHALARPRAVPGKSQPHGPGVKPIIMSQ